MQFRKIVREGKIYKQDIPVLRAPHSPYMCHDSKLPIIVMGKNRIFSMQRCCTFLTVSIETGEMYCLFLLLPSWDAVEITAVSVSLGWQNVTMPSKIEAIMRQKRDLRTADA